MNTQITVGDTAPPLERTITLTSMVAYAGATWDWHKLHYDQDYVAAKQLPSPIVDGQVFGALLVEQIQDWLGPQCFVHELSFTFRNLVFANETVRCEAIVTSVDRNTIGLDLSVAVVEHGTPARSVVSPAAATVLIGRIDGPGGQS